MDEPLGLRESGVAGAAVLHRARISEAVGLEWMTWTWGIAPCCSRARQGGKQRLVPIGRPAVAALEAYQVRSRPGLAIRGRGTPAVFLNARVAGCPQSAMAKATTARDGREAEESPEPVVPHTPSATLPSPPTC